MSFELQHIVPWGRNLAEYKSMFNLKESDFNKKIIGFGDGPASFNTEATKLGVNITSLDPIYQFSCSEIKGRIEETRGVVMKQVRKNEKTFVWDTIESPDELEKIRLAAMGVFLEDFENGKKDNRYIYHELPKRTSFDDNTFHLGLSSHFLLLYDNLGIDFHIASLKEMLRICEEVRIFPIVNLKVEESKVLREIFREFENQYNLEVLKANYEIQKGGDQFLKISK